VRHAHQDPGTLLAWAKTEVFAFVVYYRQGTSKEAQTVVEQWSREMNDVAIELGGAYYLPYQVMETRAQFVAAYPRAREFFELKKAIDPQYRFRNQLLLKVYNADGGAIAK
jgi:FAD/FMN-containing dehydrogenase